MYKVSNTRSVRTSVEMCGRRYFGVRTIASATVDNRPQTCSASLPHVSYSRVLSLHNDPLVHQPSEEGVSLLRERFQHEFAVLRITAITSI